ncbi:MAG TPA: protein kinase [Gemmatimonadaceae bacterium]|nr:protein kinase [Gemmatimonadaceae bacterium]
MPLYAVALASALAHRYRLERELGVGGMATVYLAEDLKHHRQVAIKVLKPNLAAVLGAERFLREIQLTAGLQHPHILPLFDSGQAGDMLYYVMPYVDGESLRDKLARDGALPIGEAVQLLREVADALAKAHQSGIVHRDIKPGNILVSDGHAVVMDFGIAHAASGAAVAGATDATLTGLGMSLGTPAYMAPEQAAADPRVDARADIYAFGVVAYEVLSGQPPFTAGSAQQLIAAQMTTSPEPIARVRPAVPTALAALVMRCLAKQPADRPQSMAEVIAAMDGLSRDDAGRRPRRRLGAGILALAGLVAVLLLVWRLLPTGRTADGAAAWPTVAPPHIAVLPFESLGGDSANAYLADGIATDLTAALARIPGLAVVPRSSAFALRGRTARDAAKLLGVSGIVEGTIGRANGRLRVTVALDDPAHEAVLWSASYDQDESSIFSLHDSIATGIASALDVTLSPAIAKRLATPGTRSVAAHDLVLRSTYIAERAHNEAAVRQAIALANQAIGVDSTYAAAWIALATAWYRMADGYVAPHEALPHMLPAARRAAELDPQSAESYGLIGAFLSSYQHQWADARREFRISLSRDSTNGQANIGYAWQLWGFGHRDSALAYVARAVRFSPLSPDALMPAVQISLGVGRLDDAEAYCRRLRELDAGSRCHAEILLARGEYRDAVHEMRALAHASPTNTRDRMVLARALALVGDTAAAKHELDTLVAYARTHYVDEYRMAAAFLALGERSEALDWLERGLDSDAVWMCDLDVDPRFRSLHGDPRFESLVQRLGLRPGASASRSGA